MIEKSVKQTVEHKYQDNNTAAMVTFDLIQEGVSLLSSFRISLIKIPSSLSAVVLMGQRVGLNLHTITTTFKDMKLALHQHKHFIRFLDPVASKINLH